MEDSGGRQSSCWLEGLLMIMMMMIMMMTMMIMMIMMNLRTTVGSFMARPKQKGFEESDNIKIGGMHDIISPRMSQSHGKPLTHIFFSYIYEICISLTLTQIMPVTRETFDSYMPRLGYLPQDQNMDEGEVMSAISKKSKKV